MAKPIVSGELWQVIEPLLPAPKPRRFRYPGRLPLANRAALTGILFVLKTGIAWNDLPWEMGCGTGPACWLRLRDWHLAGVWDRLHAVLLARLRGADKIDWRRAVVDSSSVRALRGGGGQGGAKVGPNPTDRGRSGSKHHLLTDAAGLPLAVSLTGANVPDGAEPLDLVDAVGPVGGKPGRPRQRPDAVLADRAYDAEWLRAELRQRRIRPVLARRRQAHGSGLGVQRWVVARTHAWMHGFRRLRARWETRDDLHEALLKLACGLVCFRAL